MSISLSNSDERDIYIPQCNKCVNYIVDGRCNAFNKIIPEKILTGEHDHTKPFKGDGGIRFEPVKPLVRQNKKP